MTIKLTEEVVAGILEHFAWLLSTRQGEKESIKQIIFDMKNMGYIETPEIIKPPTLKTSINEIYSLLLEDIVGER